jgi:hypothetical protein
MHWIVQDDVFNEERYADVLATLQRGGIAHTTVRVIPVSRELDPEPDVRNPVAVIGSYALVMVAHRRGWGPGVFYSDQITFPVYAPVFGRDVLNHDARVCRLGDVHLAERSFLRPTQDTKDFPGKVMDPAEFEAWRTRVCSTEEFSRVTADTEVVVAPLKEIHSEYRFFVVEGRVVTASRYKLGGRLSESAEIPPFVREAAERYVERWQPDRAFVIDLAVTPDGIKVIEFNNINSSGWYHADVSKVIQAIDAIAP